MIAALGLGLAVLSAFAIRRGATEVRRRRRAEREAASRRAENERLFDAAMAAIRDRSTDRD